MTPGRRTRPARRGRSTVAAVPFLLRRGAAQVTLLTAVLGILVAGGTLIGTGALLLTEGEEAAVHTVLDRSDAADLTVEVAFRVTAIDPQGALADAGAALTAATQPFEPAVSTWLSTAVRSLVDTGVSSYLVATTDLAERADLVDGRWPSATDGTAALETAIPEAAAQRFGLQVGDAVVLDEVRDGISDADRPGTTPQPLTVVGIYRPTTDRTVTWSADVLTGAGYAASWTHGSAEPIPVVGPLFVDQTALLDAEPSVDRVTLVASPTTVMVDADDRARVRADVASLITELRETLGDRTAAERVTAPLRRTLVATATHERVIGSVVLVVVLLGAAVAGAALGLAGRLVAVRRAAENALLAARGARRGQLVGRAAAEGAVLALLGAGAAVPLAIVVHSRLRVLAGLGAGPTDVTTPLVVAVTVGALLLAGVLVAPTWRAADVQPRGRRNVRARVARVSGDLALVALAVVAYLQLRVHPMSGPAGVDPVLVLAPSLCVVAGAAVALRLVPWVAGRAALRSARSRRLVVPLATWEVSRRRHSAGAALLLVLATAAGAFAIALDAAWSLSIRDQADAEIGTDLEVARSDVPPLAQAVAVADATGGTVLPVVDRAIVLGAPAGGAASDTRLLAFDIGAAASSLHSRLPAGASWAELTDGLADPRTPGIAVTLHGGAVRMTIQTVVSTGPPAQASPTVVVRAAGGARLTLTADPVALDGAAHTISMKVPADGQAAPDTVEVVAVELRTAAAPSPDQLEVDYWSSDANARVTTTITFPDAVQASGPPDGWTGTTTEDFRDLRRDAPITGTMTSEGASLESMTNVSVVVLAYLDNTLLLTPGTTPEVVPVTITAGLAEEIAASPGDLLSLDVGHAPLTALVKSVLPSSAALPHGASILADHDTLARAVGAEDLDADLADVWWVTDVADPESAAGVVAAQHLGVAQTRASVTAAATDDPLRSLLQAALLLLVAAACTLALAGTVVQTAATLHARAVDVARLLGMGVPSRAVTAALVLENGLVAGVAVLAGCAVGAVGGLFIAPLLIVSAGGTPPVPAARAVWSWPAQGGLLAVLLIGCAAVAAPVAAGLVRRARATHLRMDVQS